ncbi:ubiquitin-protein ligase peroxin 12 [Sugiyamaella lignohabitans]|uniref:Peroxisome assembly protein 12 n=1 Tax=Sugiyamaella lignohabitans TaxID=796027 RepID=A0A167D1W9_9ASCO|nr:ubiquitin-protein ligase peroxin 12 [Sugiyamaella lignohabitans]ANB12376.1 ubiquitin-protein ligase peroxin 12 [Sugiyamaella lignohabitans]
MDYFSSLNANSLDPDTPTIFELLSAKQLQDLISPSLRYIITFYAQRNPQYLLKIANRYDELYLLLMGLVEYYHLKNWNSSFTEKFYGIKRTRNLATGASLNTRLAAPAQFEKHRRLTKKQVLGSLFFVMVLPYIKEKLDARHEMLKGRYMFRSAEQDRIRAYESGQLKQKVQFEFDQILLKWYPTVTMLESSASLAFYLFYLFSKTSSSGPADFLLGMKYSRMSQYDYQLHDKPVVPSLIADSDGDNDVANSFGDKLVDLITTTQGLVKVKDITLSGLSFALPTSMFLLKFLEWWNASDFARQLSKKTRGNGTEDENLPVPDYPQARTGSGLCPLCSQPLTNPTAIETGTVFCYLCIYRHLESGNAQTGGRCPVTGQRLLGCKYSPEKEGWEVSGLRRLVL